MSALVQRLRFLQNDFSSKRPTTHAARTIGEHKNRILAVRIERRSILVAATNPKLDGNRQSRTTPRHSKISE
jgi:hypothetical protein